MKAMHAFSVVKARSQLASRRNHKKCTTTTSSVPEIVGMEKHLSSELTHEYKRRKRDLFLAVKVEQRLHREVFGCPNPDRLAMVSRNHTRWAMERARMAALLLQDDMKPSHQPKYVENDLQASAPMQESAIHPC